MFDDLLDIASGRNLVTPVTSFVQDMLNGPHCFFSIPALAGWTKRQVRHILTRNGVRVWGLIDHHDEIIFTVREDQARWAYYVLSREGIPILFPRIETLRASARRDRKHTKATTGPLETIFRFLDKLNESLF
ncbi:MAG: hypothetical protein Kow0063_24520 [Anaerolineae bacterium]